VTNDARIIRKTKNFLNFRTSAEYLDLKDHCGAGAPPSVFLPRDGPQTSEAAGEAVGSKRDRDATCLDTDRTRANENEANGTAAIGDFS